MNQSIPKPQTHKKWLPILLGILAILFIVSGILFVAFRQRLENCGAIEQDAKALALPKKFEYIKEERVECNNFIERYPDKYDQIYRLSSVTQNDLTALQEALEKQGYATTEFPTSYQKGEYSVLAKFGEHLSVNNQLDTARIPSKNPVYLKLEWRGPH